jgi:hypothetical protein
MSTVLHEPEVFDEFADHSLVQPPVGTIRKEETRYLFNALDVITPKQKRDCRRLVKGGHVVQAFCLTRTRGFIRKGRITPLDLGGEPILEENAPDDSSIFPIHNPDTPVAENSRIMIGSQSPLVAIPAYPGVELPIILNGSANTLDGQRFCLVEIKELIGHKYRPETVVPGIQYDPSLWELQTLIFPQWPEVPVLLTEFRNCIEKVHQQSVGDEAIRSICEDMLTSCEIGSIWANERIESEHRLMRQGALASGFAYVYSELAEVLLQQLGLPRQDQELKTISELAKSFQSGQGHLDVPALITGLTQLFSTQNREFAKELLQGLAAKETPAENRGEVAAVKESAAKTKAKE